MNTKAGLTGAVCAVTVILLLASCTPALKKDSGGSGGSIKASVNYTALQPLGTYAPENTQELLPVQENEYLSLFYDESTAGIAVFDKRTGRLWHSNPQSRSPQGAAVMSQLHITTISTSGTVKSRTSYQDSLLKNQVRYNSAGILTVTYTFGDITPDVSGLPSKLTEERYQELLSRTGEDGKRLMARRYTGSDGIWTLRSPLTRDQAERLKALFDSMDYSSQELEEDNRKTGAETRSNETGGFEIPLNYKLEEDSLAVWVDNGAIRYPENEFITSLNILPYFGAMEQDTEGYILIPDGSGALIDTTRQRGNSGYYLRPVYGQDHTLPSETGSGTELDILLPVFGISRPDGGVLAVIEDNEAAASVKACKPGYADDWTTVSADFALNAVQNIGLTSDSISRFYVTSDAYYPGSSMVRYIFLDKDHADYSGMANIYREYLLQKTGMEPLRQSGDIPFFLDTVGAVKAETSTLGIIRQTYVPLTSYSDNIRLIEALRQSGVQAGSIALTLTGWMEGGRNQGLAGKAGLLSILGGKNELKELLEYTGNNDVTLYPQVLLNTMSAESSLIDRNSYASQTLAGKKSVLYDCHIVTGKIKTQNSANQRYLISPFYQASLSESFLSSLSGLGISGISLGDIAHTAYGDYNEKHQITRQASVLHSAEIVGAFAGHLDALALSAPNDHTAVLGSVFTDVPSSSSGFQISRASVPFYQMVFHGYADYAFGAMNYDPDLRLSILRCAEYGAYPRFEFIYHPEAALSATGQYGLYAAEYSQWLEAAGEAYDRLNRLLQPVRNETVTGHREIMEGVYRTQYSSGYCVYVNYNEYGVSAEGVTLGALDAEGREGEAS